MQNFNYHQHTYRCGHADLDMEDEEYVQEYIKMGFFNELVQLANEIIGSETINKLNFIE